MGDGDRPVNIDGGGAGLSRDLATRLYETLMHTNNMTKYLGLGDKSLNVERGAPGYAEIWQLVLNRCDQIFPEEEKTYKCTLISIQRENGNSTRYKKYSEKVTSPKNQKQKEKQSVVG